MTEILKGLPPVRVMRATKASKWNNIHPIVNMSSVITVGVYMCEDENMKAVKLFRCRAAK